MSKKTFVLLMALSTNALSQSIYNPVLNILTLDSVSVNGIQYNNVSVNMGTTFSVISVGSTAPPAVLNNCATQAGTTPIFTNAQYNAINLGMTKDEVSQLLGCTPSLPTASGNFLSNQWVSSSAQGGATHQATITVWFDGTDKIVTNTSNSSILFKTITGF